MAVNKTNDMNKKLIFVLLISLFVCCTKKRDNDIVFMHNFLSPESLFFELTSPTILSEDTFSIEMPETLKMYQLNKEETKAIKKLVLKASNEHSKRKGRDVLDDDTLYYDLNNQIYIYGKLKLQPRVNSILLYDVSKITSGNQQYYSKQLYLLNIKENKVSSIVFLSFYSDLLIDNPFKRTVYFKNNCFTEIRKVKSQYPIWIKFDNMIHGYQDSFVKTYYSHYKVNENGYVEFVDCALR